MAILWQDLRFARPPAASIAGIHPHRLAALALGIGANTAIFSVVNTLLLEPLPYKDPVGSRSCGSTTCRATARTTSSRRATSSTGAR